MSEGQHIEVQPPKSTEKKKTEIVQPQKPEKKSFFQEVNENITKAWGGFKEDIQKLWGKAGETLESVNKKAKEISEKISIESVSNYFKTQSENFKDGIEERSYDIYGAFYDIGAGVSQARKAISHFIFDGSILATYLSGNPGNAEKYKVKAKEYYEKAKVKAKENRERAKRRSESAKQVREVVPKKENKV